MKKISFLPKLLLAASLMIASTSFAQSSGDTAKTGKPNDPMVTDPGQTNDPSVVNPGKPSQEGVINPGTPNDNGVVNPGKANDEGVVYPGNTNDDMAAMTDSGFINKNIMDNTIEIQLSKLGRDKGTSPAVKKAAAIMITDHTAILNDLKKLAAKKQTGSKGSQMNDMQGMAPTDIPQGADFNSKWASAMLTMHEAKISELEKFMRTTHDPALKAAIGRALPKIRAHRALLAKIPGAEVTKDPNAVIQ
jgi:putative membrane protein